MKLTINYNELILEKNWFVHLIMMTIDSYVNAKINFKKKNEIYLNFRQSIIPSSPEILASKITINFTLVIPLVSNNTINDDSTELNFVFQKKTNSNLAAENRDKNIEKREMENLQMKTPIIQSFSEPVGTATNFAHSIQNQKIPLN